MNNTRLTIPAGKGGKWRLLATVGLDFHAGGERILRLRKNGTSYLTQDRKSANTSWEYVGSVGGTFDLAAGDYIEVIVYQSSAATGT